MSIENSLTPAPIPYWRRRRGRELLQPRKHRSVQVTSDGCAGKAT